MRQHHGDAGEVTIEDERLARAISELPGVKGGRRDMVHKGVQELIMAAAQLRLGHGDATAKLRVALQGVLDDGLDGEEDGYYSSEDEDEIDPETAAKGLGSAGRVHVHAPLWRRLVPQDLLRAYEKHAKARGANLKSHCTKLPLMMRALRVDARGVKRTHPRPTSRAFLRPKNRQKCRMILDACPINGADPRRPQKFTLSGLEQLRDWMRGGGGCGWPNSTYRMHFGASCSRGVGAGFLFCKPPTGGHTATRACPSDGAAPPSSASPLSVASWLPPCEACGPGRRCI